MGIGHGGDGLQAADAAEDPAGQVGVEPDPFPVGLGERGGLLPHRVGNPHPAEIVNQARLSHHVNLDAGEPEVGCRCCGQLRDRA